MLLLILNSLYSCKKNTQDPNALTASVVNDTTNFLFEGNSTGVTLTRYKGTATHVTVPSMYKNKPVTKITGYLEKNSYYPDYQPEFPYIAHGAFENTLVESVFIPNSVTSISNFNNCINLNSLRLSDSLKSISLSFSNSNNFSTLTIPSKVTSVDVSFSNCTNLKNLAIPSNVNSFDIRLSNCNNFSSLTIPSSVHECDITSDKNLKNLRFESNTPTSPYHYYSISIPSTAVIYVPRGSIDKYKNYWDWFYGNGKLQNQIVGY